MTTWSVVHRFFDNAEATGGRQHRDEAVHVSFERQGVEHLAVSSRTAENAQHLAAQLDADALPFEEIHTSLDQFDIVISSTAAPGLILKHEDFHAARRARPAQPFFLIDLAMPRDLDPSLNELENCYLYNLDDLAAIANENLARRNAECDQAHVLLNAQAWQLWLQLRRRSLMPTEKNQKV